MTQPSIYRDWSHGLWSVHSHNNPFQWKQEWACELACCYRGPNCAGASRGKQASCRQSQCPMKKNGGGGASQGPRVHWHREEGGGAKKGGLQDTHTPRGGHSLLQKQLSWGKWRRQCCKDGIAGPVTIATKGSCSFQKAGSAPA